MRHGCCTRCLSRRDSQFSGFPWVTTCPERQRFSGVAKNQCWLPSLTLREWSTSIFFPRAKQSTRTTTLESSAHFCAICRGRGQSRLPMGGFSIRTTPALMCPKPRWISWARKASSCWTMHLILLIWLRVTSGSSLNSNLPGWSTFWHPKWAPSGSSGVTGGHHEGGHLKPHGQVAHKAAQMHWGLGWLCWEMIINKFLSIYCNKKVMCSVLFMLNWPSYIHCIKLRWELEREGFWELPDSEIRGEGRKEREREMLGALVSNLATLRRTGGWDAPDNPVSEAQKNLNKAIGAPGTWAAGSECKAEMALSRF